MRETSAFNFDETHTMISHHIHRPRAAATVPLASPASPRRIKPGSVIPSDVPAASAASDAAGFIAWSQLRAIDPAILVKIAEDRTSKITELGKSTRGTAAHAIGANVRITHQRVRRPVDAVIGQLVEFAKHLRAVAGREGKTMPRSLAAASLTM